MSAIRNELNIPELRSAFLRYTTKAFGKLPPIAHASILDIGCGTGSSMLALAALCNADIFGIDIDEAALSELRRKIDDHGLSNRLHVINRSLLEVDFPDETFDLLWEEGALHLVDTRKALRQCRRLLKPKGFLVLGETLEWFESTKSIFAEYGFALVERVLWSKGCWWTEYYAPLQERLQNVRKKVDGTSDLAELARYDAEIAMVKSDVTKTDCAHFIMCIEAGCRANSCLDRRCKTAP
jgi:ubiquinone/menaquinone biosynthesis C-methylase UbiE